jgi:hypothetical protein
MEDVYSVCQRMIYMYNLTQEEYRSLNPNDFPLNDTKMLQMVVDYIVNDIHFSKLSESFQKIWLEDKFAYMTWGRDKLIKN